MTTNAAATTPPRLPRPPTTTTTSSASDGAYPYPWAVTVPYAVPLRQPAIPAIAPERLNAMSL